MTKKSVNLFSTSGALHLPFDQGVELGERLRKKENPQKYLQ